jgi:hypothetical protein
MGGISGLSVYLFASGSNIGIGLGASNQAGVTAALDDNGTGTTN